MAMQRYEHKGSSTLSLALRNYISFCIIFQETCISHKQNKICLNFSHLISTTVSAHIGSKVMTNHLQTWLMQMTLSSGDLVVYRKMVLEQTHDEESHLQYIKHRRIILLLNLKHLIKVTSAISAKNMPADHTASQNSSKATLFKNTVCVLGGRR